MARFDIQLLGDKELQQDAIQRVPMRAVRFQQGVSTRRMRQLQRVAQHFARLRNRLYLKPLRRRKHRVGYRVVTGTRQQLGITGKYYYPAHVEWGHAGPSGSARRTPTHRYLRLAIKNEALLGMLTAEIRAGIARHAADPPGSGSTLPST